MLNFRSPPRPRRGYTLVELLVVIAIISVLAGLILAAVQKVRSKGPELKAKADLQKMIEGLGSFKTKFNRNPPCNGGGPTGTFRLASAYIDPATGVYYTGFTDASPEIVVLKQLFPRIDLRDTGLRRSPAVYLPPVAPMTVSPNLLTDGILGNNPALLDPNQCFVFFMSGGVNMEYLGLSTNAVRPFIGGAGQRLPPYFEFPKEQMQTPLAWFAERAAQFNALPSAPAPAFSATSAQRWEAAAPNDDKLTNVASGSNEPWFRDPWGSPYLYIATSGNGSGGDYAFRDIPAATPTPLLIGPWGGKISGFNRTPALTGFPAIGPTAYRESANRFVQHANVQILAGGPNGSTIRNDRIWGFGPGGLVTFGSGAEYDIIKGSGGDDFASFRQTALGVSD